MCNILVLIREWRIRQLYKKLAVLATGSKPGEYRKQFTKIRSLQEDEAERMSKHFLANCPFHRGAIEEAIHKADELIESVRKPQIHRKKTAK